MRVLLVEDEPTTRAALVRGLRCAGFAVDEAADAEEARLLLAQRHYDAVVLDRRLPGESGDGVLAWMRRQGMGVPVLMLTALDRVQDRVSGLEAGADDYLVKPFAFEELVARLRALIRRAAGWSREASFADLVLDRERFTVRCGSRQALLTPREMELLQALMQAGGKPLAVEALLDAAWPEPSEASEQALWTHIANLRRKLRLVGSRVSLRCRRQVGYYLDAGGDAPS